MLKPFEYITAIKFENVYFYKKNDLLHYRTNKNV